MINTSTQARLHTAYTGFAVLTYTGAFSVCSGEAGPVRACIAVNSRLYVSKQHHPRSEGEGEWKEESAGGEMGGWERYLI